MRKVVMYLVFQNYFKSIGTKEVFKQFYFRIALVGMVNKLDENRKLKIANH